MALAVGQVFTMAMVCVKPLELDAALVRSPAYVAVRLWSPTLSALVASVAEPLDNAAEPSVVSPSRNVTVPVAVAGLTVAVSVTDWPGLAGFAEDASAVVVAGRPR